MELVSQGMSQNDAYDKILQSTATMFDKESVEESASISAFIEHSTSDSSRQIRRLPEEFGKSEIDGQKRYDLRRVIGSGSQGTMYEAVDRVFAEDGNPAMVALKIAHDQSAGERSMLEGARARRVRHKNIARVHDCGYADNGESYVTYELIDGLPLDAWMKNQHGSISTKEACGIVIKLAQGVQSAHNAAVIHRDLKPSNILMTRDKEPIITDFGIAHTTTSDPRLSSYYGTRGSLAFMAPEQYHGTNDGVMPSVDTYALGGLLYWLLTGRYPNGETVSDALTRLDARNEGGAERIYSPTIHPRLVKIIEKSLAVDLADRYNCAASLAADIESYLEKRPILWLDNSWMSKAELFTRRNPLTVVSNFAFMGLVGLIIAVWMNAQADVRLEQSQAVATLELQQAESESAIAQANLNGQVILEQDRVRQLRERNLMAKNMLTAWTQAVNNRENEPVSSANMLFLYTVSTSGFLDDDPSLALEMLDRRVQLAEEYLATLTPTNSSPILRAQWHEMLGVWYVDQGSSMGNEHLVSALELINAYAPNDLVWKGKIESHISSPMQLTTPENSG